jgi:anthranilate phosphoribosyltransferase
MESHGLTSSSATEFTDAQARAVMSRILASRTSNEAKDAALYALEVKVENQNPRGMANPILTEIHNAQYKLLDKDGWK